MDEDRTGFVKETEDEVTLNEDHQTSGNLVPSDISFPVEQQSLGLTLTSTWNEYRLYCHRWECTSMNPKALLFCAHGVTEHLHRYEKLGQLLAENGILMFSHDHVGHGRSEGDRVHVETFNTYVLDVIQHVERMKREHSDIPCFLMGHSMGGLIASHVAVQRQDLFCGVVLSSPSLLLQSSTMSMGPITKFITKAVAFLMPKVPLIPWSASAVSSMEEEVQAFEIDSLIYHGWMKFGWAGALVDSVQQIHESIHEIYLPVLLIHGKDDTMVPISCSEFAYRSISSEDKTLEVFEDNRHEVLHDNGQGRARQLIVDWILDHFDHS